MFRMTIQHDNPAKKTDIPQFFRNTQTKTTPFDCQYTVTEPKPPVKTKMKEKIEERLLEIFRKKLNEQTYDLKKERLDVKEADKHKSKKE